MFITFKFRVKDASTRRHLDQHARAVNFVWNYCCQIQREAQARYRAGSSARWPTAFDLIKLCAGTSTMLGLHSDTISATCRRFVASRDKIKRCPRFRASRGSRRALGWIPYIPRALKVDSDAAIYLKRKFRFWKSREIEGQFKAGAFVQDARGRWYVTFQCDVAADRPTGNGEVGIDLGLRRLATLSDGRVIPALRHYRQYEAALRVAQRARRKDRVRAIHAKIANARRHHLHEQSTRIARENQLIVVGNVSAAEHARTRLAKSVLDAGWSSFRHMLEYKASRHRARYVEADERWTTQLCSGCGSLGGPEGIAQLGIRHWHCSVCGQSHDRDVNAARNILSVGRERPPLVGEIAVLGR